MNTLTATEWATVPFEGRKDIANILEDRASWAFVTDVRSLSTHSPYQLAVRDLLSKLQSCLERTVKELTWERVPPPGMPPYSLLIDTRNPPYKIAVLFAIPTYAHTCDKCAYLGRGPAREDLYVCCLDGHSSLVVREGNSAGEYQSVPLRTYWASEELQRGPLSIPAVREAARRIHLEGSPWPLFNKDKVNK